MSLKQILHRCRVGEMRRAINFLPMPSLNTELFIILLIIITLIVDMCMCNSKLVCGSQRSMLNVTLNLSSPYILRWGLWVNLALHGSSCPWIPTVKIIGLHQSCTAFTFFLESKLKPSCLYNKNFIELTEPPPQFPALLFSSSLSEWISQNTDHNNNNMKKWNEEE